MGRLCHGQKTGPDQEEDKSVFGIATWFCYLKKERKLKQIKPPLHNTEIICLFSELCGSGSWTACPPHAGFSTL